MRTRYNKRIPDSYVARDKIGTAATLDADTAAKKRIGLDTRPPAKLANSRLVGRKKSDTRA